jgi:LDH2 family malate/lactate/ureidoglycolate dehydrogenase
VNVPPKDAIRVPADLMRLLVATLLERVGVAEEDRSLLADLLVRNDLRGVFSHGSRQVATYARDIREGKLNPRPTPSVVTESPALLHLDGDDGLGYFASYHLAQSLASKARSIGVAVGVTRNHGHCGAAGIYSRIAVTANLFEYATSGHQLLLEPGQSILTAAGGSPHSFSAPTGVGRGRTRDHLWSSSTSIGSCRSKTSSVRWTITLLRSQPFARFRDTTRRSFRGRLKLSASNFTPSKGFRLGRGTEAPFSAVALELGVAVPWSDV